MTRLSSHYKLPPGITQVSTANLRDPAVLLSLLIPALIGLYLLLTSTITIFPEIWPYDVKRIFQFGLFFTIFLIPLSIKQLRQEVAKQISVIPNWIQLSLLAIAVIGIVSATTHAQSWLHLFNSLSEVVLLYSLLMSAIVVAATRRIAGKYFDWVALALLTVTGLAVGVQEILGVFAAHSGNIDFTFRISLLHFSWPRFYNQVQAWLIPAIVALPLLFPKNGLARTLCLLTLGLQWYIMLMTGARGLFIAISLGTVFALIALPRARKLLLTWQLAGLFTGALIYGLVLLSFEYQAQDNSRTSRSAQIERSNGAPVRKGLYANEDGTHSAFFQQSIGRPMINTSGRLRDFKLATNDAIDNPILGFGPMNYVCTAPPGMSHPHNFPLQLAAEWGIPVALLVCVLFLAVLKSTLGVLRNAKLLSHQDQAFGGLLVTGIFSAAVYGCLSGVFVMPASQVAGVLICGLLLGLIPLKNDKITPRIQVWPLFASFLLSAGLLTLGAFELYTMERRASLLEPYDSMLPRIWQDARVCTHYVEQ